jgi:biopolymer transport protein ExbB/TolQ
MDAKAVVPAEKIPSHALAIALAVAGSFVFIGVMTAVLGDRAAAMLLDRGGSFPYPFTIQNATIVLFAVGLGEIFVRWSVATRELRFAKSGLLPEDTATVLQSSDLGAIHQRVTGRFDEEHGFLPYLISLCILQFHSSRSVDQTVSVMNSTLELIAHRVDLRYTMLRYITWVIPTIGFIGTVVGISMTLDAADLDNLSTMKVLTTRLQLAFDTTLVALCLSAILVFLHQSVQKLEEQSVNRAGDYCLRNLINRLYAGGR